MPTNDMAIATIKSAIPPLSGILVIGLCTANLRTMLGLIAAATVTIENELGGSGALVGALSTGLVLLVAVGSTLVLPINRRFGPTGSVTIALVLIALALGALYVPATTMLWVAIVPGGLGTGMLGALVPWMVRDLMPHSAGAGIGAMMTGSSLGLLAATLVGAWAENALGTWRVAALIFCGVAIVSLAVWLVAGRRLVAASRANSTTSAPRGSRAEQTPERRVGLRAVFALPWMVPLIFFAGLQAAAAFAVIAWLGPASIHGGWDPSQVGVLLAIFSTLQVVGGVLAPLWAQRTSSPRTPVVTASIVLLVGSAAMIPLFGGMGSAESPWAFVCLIVVAIGHGSTFALANYIVAARSETDGETVAAGAVVLFLSQLLGAVGPVGFGVVRDLSGSFIAPFVVITVVTVVIAALAPSLWRRGRYRGDYAAPASSSAPASTVASTAASDQERNPEPNPQ